jgi:hypothetical protein
MRGQRLGFWVAVGGVAVLAQTAFNVLADGPVGDKWPAFRTANSYATRRNG